MAQRLKDFLCKTTNPQSLNVLIPIAIAPIPNFICEDFVFDLAYSNNKISRDSKQFGNMKYSSYTHCLVSFLDFINSHIYKRNTSLALAICRL